MPVSEIERELLKRCFEHQEEAWPDFIDRYLRLIHHVIALTSQNRSVTLKESEVEELAAEILQELTSSDYAALRQFRGESSLAAFLTVVTRRICVRRLVEMRQQSALGHVQAHRASFEASSTEIEPLLAMADVNRLLELLDADDAEIVRLYHVEFLGVHEIARQIDAEEASISQVLRDARQRLNAESKAR